MLLASPTRRRGGVTSLTALMLIPMFALVGFAVDLNYIWKADAELQNAADTVALTAASQLLAPNVLAAMPAVDATAFNALVAQATTSTTAAAQACAANQTAGGSSLTLNTTDVQIGFIQDPMADPSTPQGQFQPASGGNFPNSVQVTLRLDGSVPSGPLGLIFGPLLGTPTSARFATATATLRGQGVTGFNGPGGRLAPVAMSLATFNSLLGLPTSSTGDIGKGQGVRKKKWVGDADDHQPPPPPPGVNTKDTYSVSLPVATGVQPPNNVRSTTDTVPEAHVSLGSTNAGEFYLVSLNNSPTANLSDYVNWFLNGPSAADLASFGPNGLQATMNQPATMYGGPPLSGSLETFLLYSVGQTRIVPVYSSYQNTAQGMTYQVVGFAAVTVVAVNLSGPNPTLTLQPTATLDPSATPGNGGKSGSAAFVYQKIVLSR